MVGVDYLLVPPTPELCSAQLNGSKMTGLSGEDRSAICVEAIDEPWNIFATSPLVRPSLTWESARQ